MSTFRVGDRVKILDGVGTPFVGVEGRVHEIQLNDQGITTMNRHVVEFDRKDRRSFYAAELKHIPKPK